MKLEELRRHISFLIGFLLFSILVLTLEVANSGEFLNWSGLSPQSENVYLLDGSLMDTQSLDLDESQPTEDKVGLQEFLLDSLVIYLGSWPFVLAFDSNTRSGIFHSSFSQWVDNMSKVPIWNDGSSWVTNNVGHPFLGATYFLYYRSQGHNLLASSVGVVLETVLFEYTIEGIHVRPSLQDLVKTPGMGIPLGFAMDELSVYFLKKKEEPLRYLGYVFNPFNLLPWSKDRWHAIIDPLNKNLAFSIKF